MRLLLILVAAGLSLFDGLVSSFVGMALQVTEGSALWYSIYLPITLWVVALTCLKIPRIGAVAYVLICFSCVALCCDPWHYSWHAAHWGQCLDNHRWSVIGGVLLIVNAIVPRE